MHPHGTLSRDKSETNRRRCHDHRLKGDVRATGTGKHDSFLAGHAHWTTQTPASLYDGRVKGRRPRAIGRFSLLFRARFFAPEGRRSIARGASPWDTRVMPSPEAPEGRPRLARGRPTLGEAGLAGVFAGRPGARSPLSGLRRLAMSPTQRLAPLAINCCPSGARRDSRTPTSWNENGKRRLAPNGQPFTAPPLRYRPVRAPSTVDAKWCGLAPGKEPSVCFGLASTPTRRTTHAGSGRAAPPGSANMVAGAIDTLRHGRQESGAAGASYDES